MNYNIIKFSVILMIIEIFVQESVEQQCDSRGLRKLDETVAKLITIGNSGRSFPENKEQDLKKYCDQSEVFIREIESYKTKCMKDLPKQVIGVMVYAIKNSIKQLCRKDSKRLTDIISSTPCINKANPEIQRCYSNLIDSLLGAQQANDSRKIPHICCEFHRVFHCVSTRASRIKICSEFHIKTVQDFARSNLGNIVDLICGDYTEGSDKCEILGPPPKKLKSQRRTKSFIIPMIDLLSSFPKAK